MAFGRARETFFVASGDEVLKLRTARPAPPRAASGSVLATVTPGTLPSGYTSYIQGIAGISSRLERRPVGLEPLGYTSPGVRSYSSSTNTYSTTGLAVAAQDGTGGRLGQLLRADSAGAGQQPGYSFLVVDAGNNRIMQLHARCPGRTTSYDNGTQIFPPSSACTSVCAAPSPGVPNSTGALPLMRKAMFSSAITPRAPPVYEAS